eukprot:CAMPEP_0204391324 /NCGR_PEP_ID=MMETSP0469-20131031/61191_1 /ASSEMBLY_ACC=CAM_ASM_000384 /TAXON_ID=2969 /ORGANISM="Oxyrrhis marina" /LENGTH=319 /DNA_ID=CAMNT_0051385279 /DNA_START=30 /DNA_END=989 /DNA_ORIENTATION=+
MRFGKRLFLRTEADCSGAPYLSNRELKEALNQTVWEIRKLDQTVRQALPRLPPDTVITQFTPLLQQVPAPMAGDIVAIYHSVKLPNERFFVILESDLAKIGEHAHKMDVSLARKMGRLQELCVEAGVLYNANQLRRLESTLSYGIRDNAAAARRLLRLKIDQGGSQTMAAMHAAMAYYNDYVQLLEDHLGYLEINVAGFRKLLKRHDRQVPKEFHQRPCPFVGYHNLVSKITRQLCSTVHPIGAALQEAQTALRERPGASQYPASVLELASAPKMGEECSMVITVAQKLKEMQRNYMDSIEVRNFSSFDGPRAQVAAAH